MACSARQLVASTDGSPQKAEYRREFGGQVRGEALGGVQRRRFVDQPTELGEQSAASGCQTMVAQQPGVAAVA